MYLSVDLTKCISYCGIGGQSDITLIHFGLLFFR